MATSDFELTFLLIAIFLTLIKFAQIAARKIGVPDVLGELILGIFLGPTFLGLLYLKENPTSTLSSFFHIDSSHLELTANVIEFISEFAVLLLLFKVGMEVDFNDLKKIKIPAFTTASLGIIIPLFSGMIFLRLLFDFTNLDLIPEGVNITYAVIFFGSVITATSIGISTRIFLDAGKIKSLVAQTVVGAAIIDDIIVISLFSIMVAYFTQGSSDASATILIVINIIIFFVVSFILFKYALPYFFRKTKVYSDKSVPTFVSIAFLLFMAVFAQLLGLAMIIGAFVAGVIIGNEKDYLDIHTGFEPISDWVIPFFFLDIGLSVNLSSILNPIAFSVALALVVVAVLSKYVAGVLGTKFLNYNMYESQVIGLSMGARGEVTLILAYTGYAIGYFTELFYGIIIMSVVMIAIIIIPLLKLAIKRCDRESAKNDLIEIEAMAGD